MDTLEDKNPQGEDAASDAAADALWNEMAAERKGAAAPADTTDDQPGADEAADHTAADTTGQDDPPDMGEGDDGGAQQQGQPPASTQDIWANASPELKAAYEAAQTRARNAEHAASSDRGRIAALQRQIDQLKAGGAAGVPAANGQPVNPLETDLFKRLKEDYPEIHEALSGPLAAITAELAATKNTVIERAEADRQAAEEGFYARQEEELNRRVEGAFDLVADPRFVTWLQTQPNYVQQAAIRNGQRIEDVDEAADLVGRFKSFIDGAGSSRPATPSNTAPLADRRRAQLASASTVSTRSPSAVAGVPEDPEAAWNYFAEQRQRKKAQGR